MTQILYTDPVLVALAIAAVFFIGWLISAVLWALFGRDK